MTPEIHRNDPPADPAAQAEQAIARLREALLELEVRRTRERQGEGSGARADADGEMPSGRVKSLMDWLRADLSARFFGLEALPHVDVEPLPRAPVERAPLGLPPLEEHDVRFAPPPPQPPAPERKPAYTIEELSHHADEAFVRNAYLALLGREPDPAGESHFVWSLRAGRLSRREVLEAIRFSREGRKAGVRVKGLRLSRFVRGLQRVPLVGRFLAAFVQVARLPAFARQLELLESDIARHRGEMDHRLHALGAAAEQAVREGEGRRVRAIAPVVEALRALDAGQRSGMGYALQLRDTIESLHASDAALRRWSGVFGEKLIAVHRAAARLEHEGRRQATREELARLAHPLLEAIEALDRVAAEAAAQKGTMALVEAGAKQAIVQVGALEAAQKELARDIAYRLRGFELPRELEAFYAGFEDRFRGERADIKGRVQPYVAEVEAAHRATGDAPVLDIGCGRGEWLEVLREHGVAARGIDSNAAMVARCRELGLEAAEAEALEHLRGAEGDSLGAITAFHVIEHVWFPDLVALFDEALRALRPGGVVLVETPNPETLAVGAFTFWYDPTHRRPLPPEMVRYTAEARGFERARIVRLHPFAEWEALPQGIDEEVRSRLNTLLYGPQDYAIIAYKP